MPVSLGQGPDFNEWYHGQRSGFQASALGLNSSASILGG